MACRESKAYPSPNVNANISGEITGSFRPAGLTIKGVIKETAISDSAWSPLPTTAEVDRNALSIQNQSALGSGLQIKLRYDDPGAGYVGVEIDPKGERFYQITDTIIIYAKAVSGSGSITILTEELV